MDCAIIKNSNFYLAFSLFPVGIVGWGDSKKSAISSLNDNLYAFCNWLGGKLPKEPNAVAVSEYAGKVEEIKFKEDDGKSLKKYCEVVMQTAFSFKCMIESFSLSESENELVAGLYQDLGISDDLGIIGYSAEICDRGDFPLLRAFVFKAYSTAKEIYGKATERGVDFTDSFRFKFA